jgi:spore maturation protein CgeB
LKILIVGSDKTWAIEKFYIKYLRELGVEVELFAAYDKFYDYYHTSVFNKITFKSGISPIYTKINKELEKAVYGIKPDIIWVFKGMEIFAGLLSKFKNLGIKLINYNPDNPFIFSGVGSGNKNITKSISIYDLYLTYDLSIKSNLETNYNVKSEILPFGFDLSDDLLEECEKEEEIIRLCFLGNPDKDRAKFILELSNENIPITVYGNSWNKFLKNGRIEIKEPVYRKEFWKNLRRYRIQLNLLRPHNPNSHNMRTFEVPGVGGIRLAPKTPDHCLYFEQEKEIFLFNNISDCVLQSKLLLGKNVRDAKKIRQAARERSLKSGYRYKDRTAYFLKLIENI